MSRRKRNINPAFVALSALGVGYLAVDQFLKANFRMAAFNAVATVVMLIWAAWTMLRARKT